MRLNIFSLSLLLITCRSLIFAQTDSIPSFNPNNQYNPGRVCLITIAGATLYSGTIITLNSFWYKDYPRSKFHLFNDNDGWMQVDKAGHLYTAYFSGKWGIELMRWAGVKNKKAIWKGGLFGSLFLTSIEILDGFSAQWGASPGDFISNTMGSLLVIGQELAWNDQKILVKFSYHPVTYSRETIERAGSLFGSSFHEKLIKDYNGQTIWLSLNFASLFPKSKTFPKWLNLSLGYGAENMLGAESNIVVENDIVVADFSNVSRFRQYYFSPDIDLSKIKTNSRLIKIFLTVINIYKFPAPAIEYNSEGKFRVHPLYF